MFQRIHLGIVLPLLAFASFCSNSFAQTQTVYATSVPPVNDWNFEAQAVGAPANNNCNANPETYAVNPSGNTYLRAANLANLTVPSGQRVSLVRVGVHARFDLNEPGTLRLQARWVTDGGATTTRTRDFNVNAGSSGDCVWRNFDITAEETAWSQAELNSLELAIRREGAFPNNVLRAKAFRVEVDTVPVVLLNDECAQAIPVGLGTTAFDTTLATVSAPAWPCADGGGPDAWYRFTATSNSRVSISLCGSGYDTAIQVFSGSCAGLSTIVCNDDACAEQSVAVFDGIAGVTYTFRIGGYSGDFGTGSMVISLLPGGPPNDECTNATTVGVGSTAFDTASSTTSAPTWPCTTGGADRWYRYMATSNDRISISLCGSTYDTVLQVFSGTCSALTSIACDDDSCALQSEVSFNGVSGTSYLFRVGGFSGETGTGTIQVALLPSTPSNDECAGAISLVASATAFDNTGATTSAPNWPCAAAGADLWYRFTATGLTTQLDTFGSSIDTTLEAFGGSCSSLISIDCNDDAGASLQSLLLLPTVPGQTYHVRVGGYFGEQGTGVLNLMVANGTVGTNYCVANPNSTGQTGQIRGLGSPLVLANNLRLEASRLPLNSLGFFVTSLTQFFLPNAGGSQGNLCIAGQIGRYVAPGQLRNSGSTGAFSLTLNLNQIPSGTGFTPAFVGQTRFFQAWHRDNVGGVSTSNFTDGLRVTFQ